MTDYTPTTEQVRNAYVRGMRDTFIASANEHYEEFDRWMQAHDDEVRASVQLPTREQIAEAIYTMCAGSKQNWHKAAFREDYLKEADAVLALFPQPTPAPLIACPHWNNGGERGEVTMRKGCTACRAEARDAALVAEPPSTADMAPGTCDECGEPVDLDDTRDDRDPSTIRDVTPPKGDDRG